VAEQRDRARPHHHDGLQERRHAQDGQGQPQRPDAVPARLQLGVELRRRVVGVRGEQVRQPLPPSAAVLVALVLVPVLVSAFVSLLVVLMLGPGVLMLGPGVAVVGPVVTGVVLTGVAVTGVAVTGVVLTGVVVVAALLVFVVL